MAVTQQPRLIAYNGNQYDLDALRNTVLNNYYEYARRFGYGDNKLRKDYIGLTDILRLIENGNATIETGRISFADNYAYDKGDFGKARNKSKHYTNPAWMILDTILKMTPYDSNSKKTKITRDILNKELKESIGDISSLSPEYRIKALQEAVAEMLNKYRNIDLNTIVIDDGFDLNNYIGRLLELQTALGQSGLDDDNFIFQRLGLTNPNTPETKPEATGEAKFIKEAVESGYFTEEEAKQEWKRRRGELLKKWLDSKFGSSSSSSSTSSSTTSSTSTESTSSTSSTQSTGSGSASTGTDTQSTGGGSTGGGSNGTPPQKPSGDETPPKTPPQEPPGNSYDSLNVGDYYEHNGTYFIISGSRRGLGKDKRSQKSSIPRGKTIHKVEKGMKLDVKKYLNPDGPIGEDDSSFDYISAANDFGDYAKLGYLATLIPGGRKWTNLARYLGNTIGNSGMITAGGADIAEGFRSSKELGTQGIINGFVRGIPQIAAGILGRGKFLNKTNEYAQRAEAEARMGTALTAKASAQSRIDTYTPRGTKLQESLLKYKTYLDDKNRIQTKMLEMESSFNEARTATTKTPEQLKIISDYEALSLQLRNLRSPYVPRVYQEYNTASSNYDQAKSAFDRLDTPEIREIINKGWEFRTPGFRRNLALMGTINTGELLPYTGYFGLGQPMNSDTQNLITSNLALGSRLPFMSGLNALYKHILPPTLGTTGLMYSLDTSGVPRYTLTPVVNLPTMDRITFRGGNAHDAYWTNDEGAEENLEARFTPNGMVYTNPARNLQWTVPLDKAFPPKPDSELNAHQRLERHYRNSPAFGIDHAVVAPTIGATTMLASAPYAGTVGRFLFDDAASIITNPTKNWWKLLLAGGGGAAAKNE